MQNVQAFTDVQIKIILRENNNLYINQILNKAKEIFPSFYWNYNKVYHSLCRIMNKNKNVKLVDDFIIVREYGKYGYYNNRKKVRRVVVSYD